MKKYASVFLALWISLCFCVPAGIAESVSQEPDLIDEFTIDENEEMLIPVATLRLMPREVLDLSHMLIEMPHTHYVHNVRLVSTRYYEQALSLWADQGFTIQFSEGETVEYSLSVSIESGVSVGEVEATIGGQIGGTVTYTAERSYSVTVPEGKIGRLVFRVPIYTYLFDDLVTYYPPGIPNYSHSEEFFDNTAEGVDELRGLIYLQTADRPPLP